MPGIFLADFPLKIQVLCEDRVGYLFLLIKIQVGTVFAYFNDVKAQLGGFVHKAVERVLGYHVL